MYIVNKIIVNFFILARPSASMVSAIVVPLLLLSPLYELKYRD